MQQEIKTVLVGTNPHIFIPGNLFHVSGTNLPFLTATLHYLYENTIDILQLLLKTYGVKIFIWKLKNNCSNS